MKPTIYIHHDVYKTKEPHLQLVNLQHMREKYPMSSFGYFMFYQYFIDVDGTLTQARPEMDKSVVYKKAHENSISICLAGHFDMYLPTIKQIHTLRTLFTTLKVRYGINALHIKEHRDYQNVSCPGKLITDNRFAYLFISTELTGLQRILYRLLLKLQKMRK